MDRPKNVVNEADVAWQERAHCEKFGCRVRRLGMAAGSQKVGCALHEVPPGKRSYPMHWHAGGEEAVYVLAGSGVLRLPGSETPIGPGDYVALTCQPELAHQIVNTGAETLRYLALSHNVTPEVVFYPESKKLGALASWPPKPGQGGIYRLEQTADYWEGED